MSEHTPDAAENLREYLAMLEHRVADGPEQEHHLTHYTERVAYWGRQLMKQFQREKVLSAALRGRIKRAEASIEAAFDIVEPGPGHGGFPERLDYLIHEMTKRERKP